MAVLLVILRKRLLGQREAHQFIILDKPDRDLSCKEDKVVLPIPSLLSSGSVCISLERGHTGKEAAAFLGTQGGSPLAHLQPSKISLQLGPHSQDMQQGWSPQAGLSSHSV